MLCFRKLSFLPVCTLQRMCTQIVCQAGSLTMCLHFLSATRHNSVFSVCVLEKRELCPSGNFGQLLSDLGNQSLHRRQPNLLFFHVQARFKFFLVPFGQLFCQIDSFCSKFLHFLCNYVRLLYYKRKKSTLFQENEVGRE